MQNDTDGSAHFSLDELVSSSENVIPEDPQYQQQQMAEELVQNGENVEGPMTEQGPTHPYDERPKKKSSHETLRERKNKALLQKREAELIRLQEENEYLRSQTLQYAGESLGNAEETLRSKKLNVKRVLEMAKEEGDVRTEIDATELLGKINAQELQLEQQKYALSNYRAPQTDPVLNNDYYEEEREPDPAYMGWLQRNPWADRSSPAFDEGLAEDAYHIESALNKELKLSNQYDLIKTPEYYEEVSIRLKNLYGAKPYAQSQQRPSSSGRPFVSPASGGGGFQSHGTSNSRDVQLSRDEVDMALKTISPHDQKLTDAQRIQIFKQHKLSDMKNGSWNSNYMQLK